MTHLGGFPYIYSHFKLYKSDSISKKRKEKKYLQNWWQQPPTKTYFFTIILSFFDQFWVKTSSKAGCLLCCHKQLQNLTLVLGHARGINCCSKSVKNPGQSHFMNLRLFVVFSLFSTNEDRMFSDYVLENQKHPWKERGQQIT